MNNLKFFRTSFVNMLRFTRLTGFILITATCFSCSQKSEEWRIDTHKEWQQADKEQTGFSYKSGFAVPKEGNAVYKSVIRSFKSKQAAKSIVFKQDNRWLNWSPAGTIGPVNLGDAPVFLSLGPKNYWMFGRYTGVQNNRRDFNAVDTTLEGFDVPLKTTPFPNQYDAPGGLKEGLGGYHAWQSRDMVNWIHHGPVTEEFSKWVTTAEYVDGKAYIYYDYPNDQDPHLYIDDDLTDGKPGENMGMAFKDPSHGSDCAFIRDLEGNFHVIIENWDPINARNHSWDSPLASHAVSPNGIDSFKILDPAVDERTTPTGEVGEFIHPHWSKEHPDWDSDTAKYNIHEPEQDAYGDWAAIGIGGQYYLFADFHPAGKNSREMSVAWFTSSSLDQEFEFCGNIGQGHPDPDIGFAEGQFYLLTQTETDYVSSGPWVEKVEAHVGADTDNDSEIDVWTDWQEVKESYDYVEGFAKQIKRIPASMDLRDLPEGYGFGFELRVSNTTGNEVMPVLENISLFFE